MAYSSLIMMEYPFIKPVESQKKCNRYYDKKTRVKSKVFFIHPVHDSLNLFIAFMVLEKHSQGMPKIKVKLFANFREFTKTGELEIEGNTVRGVLDRICDKYPGLEKILFNSGNILPYVNIFLNGENILESGGLKASLKLGDEIAIFPPVSGG